MFSNYQLSDEMKRAVSTQLVLWKGKPEKKCAVFQRVFNPMLILSLIITAYIIMFYINGNAPTSPRAPAYLGEFNEFQQSLLKASDTLYVVKFYIFLFSPIIPIGLYILGFVFMLKQYKNAEYVITDRGLFAAKGIFGKKISYKPFTEIYNIEIKKEITDSICNTGTIIVMYEYPQQSGSFRGFINMTPLKIKNIPDYLQVCGMLKEKMRCEHYV